MLTKWTRRRGSAALSVVVLSVCDRLRRYGRTDGIGNFPRIGWRAAAGMGDVLSLERAEALTREPRSWSQLRLDDFTLEDMRDQLKTVKMGPLDQVLGMIPGFGSMRAVEQARAG